MRELAELGIDGDDRHLGVEAARDLDGVARERFAPGARTRGGVRDRQGLRGRVRARQGCPLAIAGARTCEGRLLAHRAQAIRGRREHRLALLRRLAGDRRCARAADRDSPWLGIGGSDAEQADVVPDGELRQRCSRRPWGIDQEERVGEAVEPDQTARRHEHDHRRCGMGDHLVDRRADVVPERSTIGQPVDEHLVAARSGDPEVALRGTHRARRWRELELEAQQRARRHGIPDLELAHQPEQHLVAFEADRELDRTADIERLRGQPASRRADDDDLLAIHRDQDQPWPGDRGELHRLVEIVTRRRVEVGRGVEDDLRIRRTRDRAQHGRWSDEGEVDVVVLEIDLADRRSGPGGEQDDLPPTAYGRPLSVERGRDHFFGPKPRTIFTSSSTTSGLPASWPCAGIIALLPTA